MRYIEYDKMYCMVIRTGFDERVILVNSKQYRAFEEIISVIAAEYVSSGVLETGNESIFNPGAVKIEISRLNSFPGIQSTLAFETTISSGSKTKQALCDSDIHELEKEFIDKYKYYKSVRNEFINAWKTKEYKNHYELCILADISNDKFKLSEGFWREGMDGYITSSEILITLEAAVNRLNKWFQLLRIDVKKTNVIHAVQASSKCKYSKHRVISDDPNQTNSFIVVDRFPAPMVNRVIKDYGRTVV